MKTKLLIFLFSLIFLACNSSKDSIQPKNNITTSSITDADKSLIDSLFIDFSGERPGAAVMIAKGEELVFSKAYGLANKDTKEQLTPASNFRIASVSKQFTAMAILTLVDSGKLKLETSLQEVFPDFPDYGNRITIFHMLTHQSGLRDYGDLARQTHTGQLSDRDVLDFLKTLPDGYFPAGAKFSYSNAAFAVLAEVVAKVSGMPFDEYMDKTIFTPAGMQQTQFLKSKEKIINRVYGHSVERESIRLNDQSVTSAIMGDGSIYTSVNDFFRWHLALNRGMFVSADLQKAAFTAQPGTEGRYGFGWFMPEQSDIHFVQHSGGTAGFICYVMRIPDRNITIAIFTNRGSSRSNLPAQNLDMRAEALLSIATNGDIPLPPVRAQLAKEQSKSLAFEMLDHILASNSTGGLLFFEKNKKSSDYYLNEKEMTDIGYRLLNEGRIDDALDLFQFNLETFPNSEHVFGERTMYGTADQLLNAGMIDQAIAFLKLNVKAYPESGKAYHSLADMYKRDGQYDLAIANYKKKLEVDPTPNLYTLAFLPTGPYEPTVLSKDTTELFVTRGEMKNDTAYVFVQGGPLLDFEFDYYDPFVLMPNTEDMLKIYPRQSQMINPGMLSCNPIMTQEQSMFEHHQTVEVMDRTIKYLKDRGKTVFVLCHSYGTILSHELLRTKPNRADKLILMASDFDEDLKNNELEDGKIVRWKNGTEPYMRDFFRGIQDDFPAKPTLDRIYLNTCHLVTENRLLKYTEVLKDKDLSNIVYVHARFDESNARTSPEELTALAALGVPTIETNGDHHSMFTKTFMTNLYRHLTEGISLKRSLTSVLRTSIEKDGIDQAVKKLTSLNDSPAYYPLNENEINLLGYEFLTANKVEAAIAIFKINTTSFPKSWNVYDSLGEAYMTAGNKKLAIVNYEKSMVLNPENEYGEKALEKLRGR